MKYAKRICQRILDDGEKCGNSFLYIGDKPNAYLCPECRFHYIGYRKRFYPMKSNPDVVLDLLI